MIKNAQTIVIVVMEFVIKVQVNVNVIKDFRVQIVQFQIQNNVQQIVIIKEHVIQKQEFVLVKQDLKEMIVLKNYVQQIVIIKEHVI